MQRNLIWSISYRIALILGFDLIWASAVIGRDQYLWLTALLVLVMYAINYKTLWHRKIPIFCLIVFGLFCEWVVVQFGVISFTGTSGLPSWLVLLWLGFGALAFSAMDWLKGRYMLAWILGVCLGPITYIAGIKFGAAELTSSYIQLVISYGLKWGVILHVLAYLCLRAERQHEAY